jgi:hypothetical protein
VRDVPSGEPLATIRAIYDQVTHGPFKSSCCTAKGTRANGSPRCCVADSREAIRDEVLAVIEQLSTWEGRKPQEPAWLRDAMLTLLRAQYALLVALRDE